VANTPICSLLDEHTPTISMSAFRSSINAHLGGIIKGRFQIFQRPLQCAAQDVRFAVLLISACFVLRNFLIDMRDESGDWAVDI
jgi:hypothetical protein